VLLAQSTSILLTKSCNFADFGKVSRATKEALLANSKSAMQAQLSKQAAALNQWGADINLHALLLSKTSLFPHFLQSLQL